MNLPSCGGMTTIQSKSPLFVIPKIIRGSPSLRASSRHSSLHRRIYRINTQAVIAEATTPVSRPKPSLSLNRNNNNAQQDIILQCLSSTTGRGKTGLSPETQATFDAAVAALERNGGIKNAADSPLLLGRWKLLFTSRPGTASPIQNSFTGIETFSVFQEVLLDSPSLPSKSQSLRINNIVDFGPKIGYLKVEAEGSTPQRPIPGFTPRKGSGLPFGLLGVSSSTPPTSPGLRVDFQFDKAAFYFKSIPFTIPYPVPFKLLGDERKGWLDITYMSTDGTFRLARGNKGTLFVLTKDAPPTQELIESIAGKASDEKIELLIDALLKEQKKGRTDGVKNPAKSSLATGGWRLIWTKQGDSANALQKLLTGVVKNWQIISADGLQLENRVELLPGVSVRALAESEAENSTRTRVVINDVILKAGPLIRFDIPVKTDSEGFVDWLYLEKDLRITKGNKGSLFVHIRDDSVA